MTTRALLGSSGLQRPEDGCPPRPIFGVADVERLVRRLPVVALHPSGLARTTGNGEFSGTAQSNSPTRTGGDLPRSVKVPVRVIVETVALLAVVDRPWEP